MKSRILIVDDSPSIRELILHHLRDAPVELLIAENAEEGLRILTREGGRLDLLLLDLIMPGMDGFAFLEAIRGDKFERHLPEYKQLLPLDGLRQPREIQQEFLMRLRALRVVVISGKEERADLERALEYRITGFLVKPFNRDSLIEKLQEVGALPQI